MYAAPFSRLVTSPASSVFRQAAEQDGFFGRSQIYIDLGTTSDDELRLSGLEFDHQPHPVMAGMPGIVRVVRAAYIVVELSEPKRYIIVER